MINFVLYEYLKETFRRLRIGEGVDDKGDGFHFEEYMVASAISKTVACCLAYPHGNHSYTFFQGLESSPLALPSQQIIMEQVPYLKPNLASE